MPIQPIQLDLQKVDDVRDERGVDKEIIAAVGLNIDVSGSMRELFARGVVQRIVERLIPVGMRFDYSGEIDVKIFSSGDLVAALVGATEDNYRGYVGREILNNPEADPVLWKSTVYGSVVRANLREYGLLKATRTNFFLPKRETIVGATTTGYPAIIYFVTDGENYDPEETLDLFKKAEAVKAPIYFMFVGIGDESFNFVTSAARQFGNVGFLKVRDLSKFADSSDIYEKLLDAKLCEWLKKTKK